MEIKKIFKEDTVTIYVSLFVIALGFYALNSDFSFFGNGRDSNGTNAIATVTEVDSDARLRTSRNIFWLNARENDFIDQGDSLFVGPESNIKIQFKDGNSITIGANSLIKFRTENDRVKLSLEYGTIKSDNMPSQIVLDDCGKPLDIKSKNAKLEIGKNSDCGKVEVKASKGEVKVNDTVVAEEKVVVVEAPPIAQLIEKPIVNETIVKLEELAPPVVIKPTVEPDPLPQAESTPEKSDDNLQDKTEETVASSTAPPEKPAPDLQPPQLVKSKIKHLLTDKNPPIAEWKKVQQAQEYIVETSDTPDFANPKVSRTSANAQAILDINEEKVYYRLKSVADDAISAQYSETGVIEVAYPTIKPNKEVIKYDYVAKSSTDKPKEKSFPIKWNSIPNAEKYVIQVDTNESFENAKEIITREPSSVIQVPTTGKYKYKITAYNAGERQISSTSKLGEIIYNRVFDMATPTIEDSYSNLVYFFQKGLGKFIWLKWNSELKPTDKFRVEVAADKNFKNIVKTYFSKRNRVLIQENLNEGQYYWRVRSESDSENIEQYSDWSRYGQIEISSGQM